MAELSKFYKVTNLIMIEYVADLYQASETASTNATNFTVYTGKDNNAYYTESPRDIEDIYANALYFIKFPDESDSEYTYVGLEKIDDEYTNSKLLSSQINKLTKYHQDGQGTMHYDKIRMHFIYGFLLDNLAGFTLQVKTNAKYLGPILKYYSSSLTHKMFDSDGNPIFETEIVTFKDEDGNITEKKELERLGSNLTEFTLLDIFFPKECLTFDNVVKWHTVPLYQNGSFYDRYLEFYIPSAYYLSIDAAANSVNLTVPNPYGYYLTNEPPYTDSSGSLYADIPTDNSVRKLTYTIVSDPTIIVNFATVSEENLTSVNADIYASTFILDPINQIALKYKSNSDYFNVRILEDLETNEIVYYPVFGEGDNAVELNYDIFNQIETGAIPLITEGFYDAMDNMDTFYETYGENAYKWIIYNDMTVTYMYTKTINSLDIDNLNAYQYTLHFTNIVDYGIPNPEEAGSFWKNTFIPRVPLRNNMVCTSILISYTCRLVNRLTSVEAIRHATLTVKDPTKYVSKRIAINNVITYKIVNQIKRNNALILTIKSESKDKYIRSYYDATNIVVKDMGNSNLYTQGQMTLYLKHSSTNYVLRLYTLNSDNVRIPYDLTGPFKYVLSFPTTDGNKIKIKPNADSNALNMGIGQLVFYITEEQVKRIMNVSDSDRYFAITTETESNDNMQSTLYEGKVAYYS